MSSKHRVFLLILIMMTVAASTAGITLFILYRTAFEESRNRLVETAHSRARMMEAIARHDAKYAHLLKGILDFDHKDRKMWKLWTDLGILENDSFDEIVPSDQQDKFVDYLNSLEGFQTQ